MPHLNLREEEYVNHAASLSLSCFILVRGFTVDGERERVKIRDYSDSSSLVACLLLAPGIQSARGEWKRV